MAGAARRGILGSLSWILLAGALIMLWLVLLSGVTHHTPLNKIYFLRADTSGIQGARPISQWTYWYVCGDNNDNCGKAVPGLPIGYAWRDNSAGAPPALVGNHGHKTTSRYYYYMWRFGWVFFLIGFLFANLAVLSGLLSCIRVVAGATGVLTLMSTFWMTLSACLMTAVFVKARDHFQDQGHNARVGPYAFGFTWASLCLLFLASCLFLGGTFIGRKNAIRPVVLAKKAHTRTATQAIRLVTKASLVITSSPATPAMPHSVPTSSMTMLQLEVRLVVEVCSLDSGRPLSCKWLLKVREAVA